MGMIERFRWVILCTCCACAMGGRPDLAMVPGAVVNAIPVASDDEAVKVIDNKVRWLGFLFEQSRDPYYGTEKWSAECLAANQIGARRKIKGGALSLSRVVLDANRRPGLCPGASKSGAGVLLYLHCASDPMVREVTVPMDEWRLEEGEGLCL